MQLYDVQIDLRFANPEEGGLEVVVAPVMRFKDIDFNANVKIEDIAPPDRIISGFALEIFGSPLQVPVSALIMTTAVQGLKSSLVTSCAPSLTCCTCSAGG